MKSGHQETPSNFKNMFVKHNFMNTLLLRIVLLPASFYQQLGVDLFQMKSILHTKLMMDDRRVSGFSKARQSTSDGKPRTATLLTMLISLFMGAVFLYSFAIQDDITRMTLYFSFFLFSLALFLITDFTHVLIDVKDNYIILPKPVNAVTFLMARLLHIIIHISKIAIPMALPCTIALGVARGVWGIIVFIPVIVLVTAFTIFIVNAAYLVIIRIFSPERFNAIISSIQIVFSILVYGSFQILPRILEDAVIDNADISSYPWSWFLPTFWFAGAWKFLYLLSPEPNLIACTVLSLVIPLVTTWYVIKYFAPSFHRKLSMIASGTGAEMPGNRSKKGNQVTFNLITRLSVLLTRPGTERGAFLFNWKMMNRNRDFKLKVYPMIGYVLVVVLLVFFDHIKDGFSAEQHQMVEYKFPLLGLIYVSCYIFLVAIYQMPYSETYRAAWIFFITPLQNPGNIISGTVKAGLVRFCLPVMVVSAIVGLLLAGPAVVPNLLFGYGNVLLVCILVAIMSIDKLPFSEQPKKAGEDMNFVRSMIILFLLFLFSIPHYFLFNQPWILSIGALFSFTLAFFTLKRLKKTDWSKLKSETVNG